jgi:hypothetical protein
MYVGKSQQSHLINGRLVIFQLFLRDMSPKRYYMVTEEQEQMMCNICGITVSASQAKQHASTSSHELHKAMLEQELNAVRKENYQNDSSLVISWERSSV